MKTLNTSLDVELAWLMSPPADIVKVATHGQLLVAWHDMSYVVDRENGEQYYFAFYHPSQGWIACRWDKRYFPVLINFPASSNTIWFGTYKGELIRVSITRSTIRTTILADVGEEFNILYADQENLWIRKRKCDNVVQLHVSDNDLMIVREKSFADPVYLMRPLADGAWVLEENWKKCVVRSPTLDEIILSEGARKVIHFPSFLLRQGKKHFYYTSDPRCGWRRMPITVENKGDQFFSFACQDSMCCALIYRAGMNKTVLYHFDEEGSDVKLVWSTEGFQPQYGFAIYDGLVCIPNVNSTSASNHDELYGDVLKDSSLLVWNPRTNAFYGDIPQAPITCSKYVVTHKLQLPSTWPRGNGEHHLQYVQCA